MSRFTQTQGARLPVLLLTLICIVYSAWVWSLPLFPTQDGPMHLYLMQVLRDLLFHPGSVYEHFYYVRHVLPPYALYYYLLMALSSVVPLLVADKLIVCLFFFLFAFGFRFLARAIGPGGDSVALLSTLLLLNWPLGMGFINFCLATAISLWALGIWCRVAGRPGLGQRIGFVVLSYVIMLTHPVPLLGVLGFCGLQMLIRLLRERRLQPLIADGWTLLAASGTLLYVRLFTIPHMTTQNHASSMVYRHREITVIREFVVLHWMTAFAGHSLIDGIYRGMYYLLLLFCLTIALRQFRRARQAGIWTIADTWTALACGFLLVHPFIPSDLNHSAFFAERLSIFVWITALVAAAGARWISAWMRPAAVVFTLAGTAGILLMAQQRIRPVARDISLTETGPSIPAHSLGLLLHTADYQPPRTLTYDPYFWSGVRMFRRTDSVMWNTPWLDLAIIPLGPLATLPTGRLSPHDLEAPEGLREDAQAYPFIFLILNTQVDAVLVSSGTRRADGAMDPFLSDGKTRWSCTPEEDYSVCIRAR